MKLFLLKCLGITLVFCLNSIFLSAQTGPAGVNSGTILWLDASDVNAGAAAPTTGSTVASWKDKSGTNHNATSTGANTAIYTSGGANGSPVIRFNRTSATSGTGFTVNGVDIRGGTLPAVTVFAVYHQGTNDGNNQAVWGNDNGSQQRFFNSKWSTGPTDGSLSTGGTAAVVPGASSPGETRLATAIYSAGAGASAVYLNGKKLSTFTDLTAASSGQSVFNIGSDGDDNYFNGDVSEIIVYDRKLTDCELETVNRYLANKYAIDFSNIGSYYSLGSPFSKDINGVGKPASACPGNPLITTANSGIAIVSNPSSVSAGAVMTFANDGAGYGSSMETPPAYSARLTQRWRTDLTGIVGTVDLCFNLEGLGIDVANSANFALLIDKDGNFSDAAVVNAGVSVFGDRVCISGVNLTKGDYFSLATKAEATVASSVTSPNEGIFLNAAFANATVIDPKILVKGSNSITNGKVYIDSGFVANDVIAWGTPPTGVTAAYNTVTGVATFTGTATAAQWQAFYRTVTFRANNATVSDRVVRFVLGNVITFSVGSTPHYYEIVTTTANWTTAKTNAAAKTLYGLQGYLATVTSQAENDYIRTKINTTGWIGGSCNYLQVNAVKGTTLYANQAAADGHYFWITGPEAGNAISNGLTNPVAAPGAYTYWNTGEPNNSGGAEQFIQLNTVKWNDLNNTNALAYVVEYGGYPSDSLVNIDYSRTLKNAPAGPVFTGISVDGGTSATDRITNDRTLIINGTSPANATITIYRDDVQVGTTTTTTTTWSFDYSSVFLADGTYNFTATSTVSSLVSALSNPFQVTIDSTAPAKPGTPGLTTGPATAINNQTPTFTGSAEPGASITLYDGATNKGTAVADATGKWTITSTSLSATSHNMTVKATDIAGNISVSSDIYVLTVDITAPGKPGTPVLVGGIAGAVNTTTPTITGTAEANSRVLIYKDGTLIDSVAANGSGNYTYTFITPLPDATYAITVRSRDAASNLSVASNALSIRVDTTPPDAPPAPTVPASNNGATTSNKPTIKGTAEANSTVIIFNNGVAVDSVLADGTGNYTYTPSVSAPDGTYAVSVKAKDAFGHVSGMSPVLTVTIDTGVPLTPTAPLLVGGNNGWINSSTPVINGVAEANAKVYVYKNGIILDSAIANASGNYTYTFLVPLPDATYSISVKAKDAAGNISAFSPVLVIKVDTAVPATPAAPIKVSGNDKPVISGTTEANAVVTVYRDGVSVGTTTADASGNYTFTFISSLPEGAHAITITATDAAANVSAVSAALNIIVDTIAPATPPAPVKVSGNDKPVISGTAEANATVTIYRDGVFAGTTTANASGNYTYTFTTSLAEGPHAITVTASDATGNVSAVSPALNISVDTIAPATPAAPVKVSGNDKPVISGTTEANATVTIYVDGVAVETTLANASGNYTYVFTNSLAEGVHAIRVTATDATGNVSGLSPALNITVDTQAPATPPAPVKVSGNDKPVISGTTEPNAIVTIYKDAVSVGTVNADASGNYTYTFTTSLADGVHAITVTATDATGNVSTASPALNITVDTIAPATPPAPVKVSGNDKPVISGTAEANTTVTIYRDGVYAGTSAVNLSGNYTWTFTTALSDGAHAITVTATDNAGNISGLSPALNITVDTQAPATPAAPVKVSGNDKPVISGTTEANATVTIYVDGVSVGTTTADASGNYTWTSTNSLAEGIHAIRVTATDAAGNVSAQSPALTITVDTIAPATPAAPVKVSGNDKPVISGTTEPGALVTIYKDGVSVATVSADASGNYTYTFATSLAEGAHAITVTATDAKGNTSAVSPALNITVDTIAPATPAAPVKVSGNDKPVISGTTEANATVTVYSDGVSVGTTTANASGNYTWTFTTSLADGPHVIIVTAADATGNVSAQSPALNISVDTIVPLTPAAPVKVSGNDKPVISGTTEANALVTVYSDGVSAGTTTADASGNYTYTFTTSLTDGPHSITVTATDAAGNVSNESPALSISVDTAIPATPAAPVLVGSTNGVTADNTPTITGVAEANSTVIIYKGGIAVDSVSADAAGNYTYTFTTLADATYSITVKSKDAAGNLSASSPALSMTVDTIVPATPAAPVLLGGNNGSINDNTPTITGVAEANSTVIIYKGGIAVDSVTANAVGNYTYTFTTPFADGTYSITVKVKDAADNLSAMSPALSITIDTVASATPFAPVLVGSTNGVTRDNTPSITGVADPNTTVIIYKGGIAIDSVAVDAAGDYTYTFTTPLADGAYSITVKDKDAAGNLSAFSPALVFTVDTVIPATPTVPVLVGGTNGVIADNTPDIVGSAEAKSTLIIYKDGVAVDSVTVGTNGFYSYTFVTPLADGTYSITVKAKDAAGNLSAFSPVLSLTVDTTPPPVPAAPVLVGGTNGVTADNTPAVKGVAEANTVVIIFKDGVAVDSVTTDAGGNYTYTFTSLADGVYSITVKDKDAMGNVSAASPALSITVDTTAPATPTAPVLVGGSNNITNDATPDIKGKAEAMSTVTIYRDGIAAGTTTADASGNYTYTFTTDLADGAHVITVTSTDVVGNVSAASPALNILIDANVPVTPAAPELTSGTNGVTTTDGTPDIKGRAEANSLVTVYSDGIVAGATSADANGDYTFTFPAELLDGPHAITVTSKDGVGNISNMSPALNIVVDVHAPARPAAPQLVNPADSITKDPTPDIKGKAEMNSTVTIYSDQVAVGTVNADANGSYTFTFTTDLTDGVHNITVTATDTVGNVSPVSAALSFEVDTHAPGRPTAPTLIGGNDGLTKDATPDISGKAEPNSTVTIYADGTAAGKAHVDANGNYTFTFPDKLAEGTHEITATATDAAGNTSENQSPALSIVVDNQAPATPSTPILVDGVNGVIKTTKPTVIGTVEPNTTVIIYDHGVQAGTTKADNTGKWIYTFDPGISNGEHRVTVTATDAAGNVSAQSAALVFTVDAIVPDVPLAPRLPGVNGFVNTITPAITGQGQPGTLITVYTDGTKSGTAMVDANGNWTYTYNPPLTESVHNINVTASTADGANESAHSETVSLTIDLVGPTVKLSSNRAPGGAVVNGTVTVTVTFSDGVSGFSWDDLKITNAKVVGFTQVSSGIYTVLISPTADGVVTVAVPKNAGYDAIGNGNAESELLTMNMKPNVGIDQVYPMPAADIINLRLTGVDDEQAVVKMTNMAGQVLLHQQNKIKEGVLTMNVQRLPAGVYVLLVVLEKGSYNTTVVIAR